MLAESYQLVCRDVVRWATELSNASQLRRANAQTDEFVDIESLVAASCEGCEVCAITCQIELRVNSSVQNGWLQVRFSALQDDDRWAAAVELKFFGDFSFVYIFCSTTFGFCSFRCRKEIVSWPWDAFLSLSHQESREVHSVVRLLEQHGLFESARWKTQEQSCLWFPLSAKLLHELQAGKVE